MKVWNIPSHGSYGLWQVCSESTGFECVASHAYNEKFV